MKAELIDNVSEVSNNSENSQNSSEGLVFRRRSNIIVFNTLDGIQSGVPTQTTPTITPTTLRSIQQTFIELTSDSIDAVPYQAGFVPPPLAPMTFIDNYDENSMGSSNSESETSWHTPIMNEENSMATTDNSSGTLNGSPTFQNTTNQQGDLSSLSASTSTTPSRRGGRRPAKASNLSPEEEEKRRVRRERNKLAAARCRKRRVDQTNDLSQKVDVLEKERNKLRSEIEELNVMKEELALCLEAHRSNCRLMANAMTVGESNITAIQLGGGRASPPDLKPVLLHEQYDLKCIKDEPLDSIDSSLDDPPSPKRSRLMLSHQIPLLPDVSTISTTLASASAALLNTPTITTSPPANSLSSFAALRPNQPKLRPNSLNVAVQPTPSQVFGRKMINGVAITTPSTGVMFNFDSLMDGGTGLTPVSGPLMPNCSSLNKHPLELTTPTSEPSKLVSL